MKKIQAVILGYGDRASRYASYAIEHPDQLEIVAVIDVQEYKCRQAQKRFALPENRLYLNLEKFLKDKVRADIVINGTMDQLHFETTIPLLKNGYNVLLEKPITANMDELFEIQKEAEKNDCKVIICHVLRYAPYYASIKKVLASGRLGKVMDMQLNEHVWHAHFVNSYVRGKWRSEKECGSGLLLAKCCHDTDLICWLNNTTVPVKVSSFGSRSFYTASNAPEGATQYCYECPNRKECMFDAYKFQFEKDFAPDHTWLGLNKPLDEITDEEKLGHLKKDVYGQCVYKTDMDIVDRQCVSVEFENGSIATLHVVGGASKAGRHLHIVCEYGEILGYIEENKYIIRTFDKKEICYQDEIVDFSDIERITSVKNNSVAGHYGGDYYIMKDLMGLLRGEEISVSMTTLNDSVNSHLICYAAEKARKENVIVNLNDFIKRLFECN